MKKYFPSIAITILILLAVLMPGSNVPSVEIVGLDKAVHFILFFIWSLALRNDFSATFNWKLALCAGAVFCVSTEIAQLFVAGRTFEGWDVFFGVLGLLFGLSTGKFQLRLLKAIFKNK